MEFNRIKYSLSKNKILFLQLGIALLLMSITRVIFYIPNASSFSNVTLYDFIVGVWMDMITIGIYFIPYYFLYLLPLPFHHHKIYKYILQFIYGITLTLILILNLIDVEYYKHTAKRSTADFFSLISTGNDVNQLFTTYLLDFWWLFLVFILLLCISLFIYHKTFKRREHQYAFFPEILNFFIVLFLLLFIGRGGFVYRPADMLTASQLTSPQKVGLVSNTPLSIVKTLGKPSLQERDFFPENSASIYNPIYYPTPEAKIDGIENVVVLILESFGDEWLGKKNGKNYTPFLDSLLEESIYFTNAFANGKKSIESLPSIFAGIPSLLDNPFISSKYETNRITSLVSLLKEKGYSSAFYHGATNGSMKFDVFTAHLGFDKYMGRKEYNNEEHSDGTWGILDEYFLPWAAKSMTKDLKEPFIASVFSLSSHHPYFVPEKYRDILPKDEHPMAQAIAYSDMSLRLFFEEAKKQSWYDKTLFIITADHTPAGTTERFTQRIGMYQIPIAFYAPHQKLTPQTPKTIFNQIDIMPTTLDILGYNKSIYSMGKSYFSKENKNPFAIAYIQNSYLFFQGDYLINFVDDKTVGLYNYKIDTLMYVDSLLHYPELNKKMENQLKGIIQRYNFDMIHNRMVTE